MKETEILVEQQPPKGVFICDHASLETNKFSLTDRRRFRRSARLAGGVPCLDRGCARERVVHRVGRWRRLVDEERGRGVDREALVNTKGVGGTVVGGE